MESSGKDQVARLNPAQEKTSTSKAIPSVPEGATAAPIQDTDPTFPPGTVEPAADRSPPDTDSVTANEIVIVSLESLDI